MNAEFTALIELFRVLRDLEESIDSDFGLRKLDHLFFNEVESGAFIKRDPLDQIRRLGGLFDMYIGRGQRTLPAVLDGRIARDFPDKLRAAACRYYLTLDLPAEKRIAYQDALRQMSKGL